MDITLEAPIAEERLLGSCLESAASVMAVVGSGLKPEDFGSPVHEILYRTIRDMLDRGQGIDVTTVTSQLEASGKLDLVGGIGVIERIAGNGSSHNVNDYASIVKDRSIRRELFDATKNMVSMIHSEPDTRTLIGSAENLIYRVGDKLNGGAKSGISTSDLVELYNQRGKETERIPYPFIRLNSETNGRERGSLTLWGGYTSDGKSIIGMQSALAAAENGYSVGYFSLEMTEEELLYRLLSMYTGISQAVIQDGSLTVDQDARIAKAMKQISSLDLKCYHDPEYTPTEIRAIQMREKFDLIVVDYLQRFYFVDWQDIPRMAKQFKNMALSTKCCVDVLSQLTPQQSAYGSNPFPIPTMNSWYGGKATGHEANNALFIWAEREQDSDGAWKRTGNGKILNVKQRGGRGEFQFDVRFDSDRIMWREPDVENVFFLPASNSR